LYAGGAPSGGADASTDAPAIDVAAPVAGGYIGGPDDSIGLNVDVAVRAVPI